MCIKEYNDVVTSIPPAMRELFEAHIDRATQNFHPGLTTLSWNSMNIGTLTFTYNFKKDPLNSEGFFDYI